MTNRLVCRKCQAEYTLDYQDWRCKCGHFLDIRWQSTFPISLIKSRKPTMWRYREAIPIAEDSDLISFDEGFTPLLKMTFDRYQVWIKQEQLFSTGSYKDRGASVMISYVNQLGIERVVEDSSGNAGAAVAAYCAAAGIDCDIYVPEKTSQAKINQIKIYGANLHCIPGSREDSAQAVMQAASQFYYASHTWNPFFLHGVKTFAFELCEQLDWQAPDALIIPVGNGTLLLGALIGFNELIQAGVIAKMPRLIGVQAENCAPLARAFKENIALSEVMNEMISKKTIAEGIAISTPLRGEQILAAVRRTNGLMLTVNETEIANALAEMCWIGHYIEPTSAVAIAGLTQFIQQGGFLSDKDVVVSVFTGHGLKAVYP